MGHFIENPRSSCALGGALAFVSSIDRAIPVLHAGPGCGLQATAGQLGQSGGKSFGYVGGQGTPSTNMFEREIIFGGVERLRETIAGTLEIMDGDLIFVLTGCTADIIGDDVESVIEEFKAQGVNIVHTETAGFKGDSYYGYNAVVQSIADQLTEVVPKDAKLVNLFGIVPAQDIFWEGNFEEIIRILNKLGLKVNSFCKEQQGLKEIKNSAGAAINIMLSPWLGQEFLATYKEKYDIDTFRYPGLPVGPTATTDFIRKLAKQLGLDNVLVEKVIAEEENYVYSYLEKIIGSFTRYRFSIVGDTNTVLGLTRFLVNDFGRIPLVAVITDQVPEEHRNTIERELTSLEYARPPKVVFENDKWKISELIKEYKDDVAFILGSDYEKEIGKKLDALTVVVSFPTTEKLIINRGYAGYRGCLTFIEDLYDNN
ncbi:MAG: nitrogenase molybdenum-iron protein, alpha and beta chain [Firmicutes bacterium]|nr:nitrogenase molybdenum-iron protein, alpha and beta chain [Bacillota bacterium]